MVAMEHFKETIKLFGQALCCYCKLYEEFRESDFSIAKHTLAMKEKKNDDEPYAMLSGVSVLKVFLSL